MTSRCLTSTWCTSSPCRSTSSWRRWRRKSLPDWNGYNSITGEVLIKTIKDYQNDKDCYWHYGRSIGAFKNTRRHIIIKQEGDKNEEELKKGHGIIYFMANIKQDELWVDLLFNGDGNTTKRIMEGLSYLHKNMNIVIVENRFMQQSVKSRSVLGNAISTVGKKSILAFWRQIHLKIQCQPHGTWQFSEIQYKSDRGRSSSRPGVDTVSKKLSDWIFVQKRPRNKLLCVLND